MLMQASTECTYFDSFPRGVEIKLLILHLMRVAVSLPLLRQFSAGRKIQVLLHSLISELWKSFWAGSWMGVLVMVPNVTGQLVR